MGPYYAAAGPTNSAALRTVVNSRFFPILRTAMHPEIKASNLTGAAKFQQLELKVTN